MQTACRRKSRLSGESDRTRWVAGVYYLNIDTDSDNGLKAPVNSIIFDLFGAPFDIGVVAALRNDLVQRIRSDRVRHSPIR